MNCRTAHDPWLCAVVWWHSHSSTWSRHATYPPPLSIVLYAATPAGEASPARCNKTRAQSAEPEGVPWDPSSPRARTWRGPRRASLARVRMFTVSSNHTHMQQRSHQALLGRRSTSSPGTPLFPGASFERREPPDQRPTFLSVLARALQARGTSPMNES